jgi:hypothetical protein
VSIAVGAGGALYLARFGSGKVRCRALAVAGAAAAVVLVGRVQRNGARRPV